jgi:Trp operon repressor
MVHISKNKLDQEVSKELWRQLLQTFKNAGQISAGDVMVKELFTYTENTMFAKRLAIILLLDRGMPQHVISEELHVSPSTVARMSTNIERGKYKKILKIAGKKKFLDILEKIILMGMPPRTGRGRWNHWGHFNL